MSFRQAYDEALMQRAPPVGAARTIPGSMNALISSFYASARFKNLKSTTAGVYRSFLEKLRVEHGDKTVAGMQAKPGRAIIEAKERPNARQRLLKLVSLLVKHAVETRMRDDNPARYVEAEVPTSEGFLAWPEDQIVAFRTAYPIRAQSEPRLFLNWR